MRCFSWGLLWPLAVFFLNLVTPSAAFTLGDLQALVVGNLDAQTSINISCLNFAKLNAPLSGPLPAELGQLTNLTLLRLSDCPFSGPIPTELGNLTGLTVLNLASNNLSGSLPPELSNLLNLTEIKLSKNHFTGSLPSEWGALTNLTKFGVSKNNLSGPIPPSFGRMQNVVSLEFNENNLSGALPPELGALQNLRSLAVQDNRLNGTLPPELGNLTSLRVLSVYTNNFTGPLPKELARCTNLAGLFMWQNNLTGPIPPEFAEMNSLVNIFLQDNLFSGPVPAWLGSLTRLQHVDLHSNSLTGTIPPELGSLPQILLVHLGNNQLTGPIPKTISRLSSLEELYLKNNKLSGPIPPELAALPHLFSIIVSGNQLTGSPPPELAFAPKLIALQVQNNSFSGPVYSGLVTKFGSSNILGGNPGLNVTDTLLISPPPPPLQPPSPKSSDRYVAIIAAACAAGAAIVGGIPLAVLIVLCLRARARRRAHSAHGGLSSGGKNRAMATPLFQPSSSSGGSGPSRPRDSDSPLATPGRGFTWAELAAATGDFADACAVGSGSFGTVYRAVLGDGSTVAVKRLDRRLHRRGEEERVWRSEFVAMSQVRHRNLVRLLGSVTERDERLLVLEFFPEGSLWARLHSGVDGRPPLSWEQRMVTAEGVCRGLAYLHHDIQPPLVHRDVKASNVLLRLDGREPCLADFGLARLVDQNKWDENSSAVKGTLLYMAPEYLLGGPAYLSTKCDVYSFGVLLLELLTGQSVTRFPGAGQGASLVEHVTRSVAGGQGLGVLDPAVWEAFNIAEAECCLNLAMRCLQKEPGARPTMEQVSFELRDARRNTSRSFDGSQSAREELLSLASFGGQFHSGPLKSGQYRFENPR